MEPQTIKRIKVYGTESCPQCQGAKKYLESQNAPFEYIDVRKDPEGMKTLDSIGIYTLTVITVNDEMYYTGFDVKLINKLIKEVQ